MALPSAYTPPKNPEELDKRKELASVLKQFARGEVKVNPEDMVKSGATMGVSRNQLSNLYQQYRKDFQNNPPQDLMGDTPPTGTTPTGTTPTGTPTQPSLFSGEHQFEWGGSTRGTPMPVKGPFITSTTPAATPTQAPPAGTQDSGPATPRLDRLAAMQGTPMGSVSIGAKGVQGATGGLARGSSPTGGTPIGRGAGKNLMGNIAANLLYRAAEDRKNQNEILRAQIEAYKIANKPPEFKPL
jgi:hypothetical protein